MGIEVSIQVQVVTRAPEDGTARDRGDCETGDKAK